MQQEIQYLQNKFKNVFEENMKLKSKPEGITQEVNPANNHTPSRVKHEIKTINIVINIRNIDKELAKQANEISEQMKSFEKTDIFVKELWKIVDGLADNGSP